MGHAIGVVTVVLRFSLGLGLRISFGLTLVESVVAKSVEAVVGGGSVVVAIAIRVGGSVSVGLRSEAITSITIESLRFSLGLSGHDGDEGSSDSLNVDVKIRNEIKI